MKKTFAFAMTSLLALVLAVGAASVASAQTSTTTGTTTTTGTVDSTTGTVGFPSTGTGGEAAMNIALLLGSGLLATGGAAYLARERRLAK